MYLHLRDLFNNCRVRVMVLNTTFNDISVVSFYWWRKTEHPEKNTDLSQVTDKLYDILLYQDLNTQR
jgi:hypothetical protein